MNHRFALLLAGGLLALGMQSTFALEVALVGDSSKLSALKRIAQEMKVSPARAGGLLRVTSVDKTTTYSVSDSSDDVVAIANQLLTSDVAFLIVDSTTGPLPVVREHLIVSRQARVPRVVIYFTSTAALQAASPKDAAELLELQEMEMRELLGKYGMDGEQAAVLFDGDVGRIYKSKFSRGQSDVSRFLTSYSLRRPPQPVLRPVSEFTCAYYLLSNPETNGKGVTLADRDAIDVWADGKAVAGAVRSSTSHKPGDVGELVLRLSAPLNTAAGSRVLLVRNGSAVGIGVVKAIAK